MREGEDLHRSRVISRLDDNGGLRDDDRVLVDFLDTLLLDLHNAEAAKGLRPGRFRSISRLSTASTGARTLRSLQGGLGRGGDAATCSSVLLPPVIERGRRAWLLFVAC